MTENTSTEFNTTDQYRVTGPATYSGSWPARGVKTGDIITLDIATVDSDGDVGVRGHGFISAASLAPVTVAPVDDDIRIPRADLPEVVEIGGAFRFDGDLYVSTSAAASRKEALRHLAITDALEARESEAAANESRRNQRRDELAREMCVVAYGVDATVADYLNASNPLQAAIDKLIAAEDRIAELEAQK